MPDQLGQDRGLARRIAAPLQHEHAARCRRDRAAPRQRRVDVGDQALALRLRIEPAAEPADLFLAVGDARPWLENHHVETLPRRR